MSAVVFTRSAQTDLLEIWTFISEDSFEAADRGACPEFCV